MKGRHEIYKKKIKKHQEKEMKGKQEIKKNQKKYNENEMKGRQEINKMRRNVTKKR